MSAASATSALALYLKSVSSVNSLVSGRIWRPQIDEDEIPNMARANIVIRRSGGYQLFGGANFPVGDPRLDIFCYGSTWLEAEEIAEAVIPALRFTRPQTFQNARLYWARIAGGPMPYEDPSTNWPTQVVSAQVAFCEIATP